MSATRKAVKRRYTTINKTIIRCGCGHRVVRRDVLQTGLYMNVFGPDYVYVRFRCGRCKRLGEQLVQEQEWDPSVLREADGRATLPEVQRIEQLGPITPEEVIEFHYALERMGADPE